VSLGMVLFVSGQYAECSGGIQRLYLRWASHEELDSTMKRITCGSHRYASLFD
jgi:hypothetical protein